MKDFTKSTGASAEKGPALPASRLDSKEFTRWLVVLLVLTASLLSIALYLEHRGVSKTRQDLTELQTKVSNKLTRWFEPAPEAEVKPALPATSGPVWAETPAAKGEHSEARERDSAGQASASAPQNQPGTFSQGRSFDSCGASSGPLAGANQAASLLEPFSGLLGKALSFAMLLVGLYMAVVKGTPLPAVTGAVGATFLGLGPSVMLSLFGCL